jgi:hypothetical protein
MLTNFGQYKSFIAFQWTYSNHSSILSSDVIHGQTIVIVSKLTHKERKKFENVLESEPE